MARPLESVLQGGFVEDPKLDDDALDAVVGLLALDDAEQWEHARTQIVLALEDLVTARKKTDRAHSVKNDCADLVRLIAATDPNAMTGRARELLDFVESLGTTNPVLLRRLKWTGSLRNLRERLTGPNAAEETVFAVARDIATGAAALRGEIELEDGRGRPTDVAALRFAGRLYDLWKKFTTRGTSRQNATGREKDPFGDFVHAAGSLVEPKFKGHSLARNVHEGRRPRASGVK